MSLANVLAVSQAAKTLILLGDPQQLNQPMQGSHPDVIDTSALDHVLDGHQTISNDRRLFLEETITSSPEDHLRLHIGIVLRGPTSNHDLGWKCRRSDLLARTISSGSNGACPGLSCSSVARSRASLGSNAVSLSIV